MDIIFKYLFNILSITAGIILAYFILRAITKDKKLLVNKLIRGVTIFLFGAVTLTLLGDIFLWNEPDALEPAVKFVKNDPSIIKLIGEYKGHSYNKFNIPDNSRDYGFYNFKVNGKLAGLSMDCYVSKNDKGDWYIVKIKNQQFLENKAE
jgi:hypothetical protein